MKDYPILLLVWVCNSIDTYSIEDDSFEIKLNLFIHFGAIFWWFMHLRDMGIPWGERSKERRWAKSKLCQHMVRVKSMRRGWTFNWKGTRDGKIFKLPEDPDTGFYKLVNPLCPIPSDCPCTRLLPVKTAVEALPIRTRLPYHAAVKTKPRLQSLQSLQSHYSDTTVTLQWHYSDTKVTLQWH